MIIIWTIICDLLIVLGKNLKFLTRYFDAHSFSFLVLIILSYSFILAGPGKPSDDRRILEEIIRRNNVSHGERILASALADRDIHTLGSLALNVSIFFLLVFGSILRFAIALATRFKVFVVVDVTWQRRFHTFWGIWAWIAARFAVVTGCSLHEIDYGPTLLVFVIVETVIALVVHTTLEIVYRVSRIKNRASLSTYANPSEENKKIIKMIREKASTEELKKAFPNKHIFIYLGRIYDLGFYVHPGGQWIFYETRCKNYFF